MQSEIRQTAPESPGRRVAFPRFDGRLPTVSRWAWIVAFGLIALMNALAVPRNLALLRTVCPSADCTDQRLTVVQLQLLAAIGITPNAFAVFAVITNLVPPLVFGAVALILFRRKPDDGMAYFTSLALLFFGGVTYPDFVEELARTSAVWVPPYVVMSYLGWVCIAAFFYIFPSGEFAPRWTRYVLVLWAVEQVIDVVSRPPLDWRLAPEWISNAAFVVILLSGLYAQVYRYRRVSSPTQRRQTKWVVFGIVVALSTILAVAVPSFAGFVPERDVGLQLILIAVASAGLTAIPVSIGVAILRSRLYDIEILINRTLVYGAVTAILAGVLAASSELTKRLFLALTGESSDLAPMVATLVVVAAFDPVKRRVQSSVDKRVKYPARSFGEFGVRLRDFLELSDPGDLVRTFLREAVDRFDAGSGEVYLDDGKQLVLVHKIGAADGTRALSVPLAHNGQQVGLIILGDRLEGDPYDDEARKSLVEMSCTGRPSDSARGAIADRCANDSPERCPEFPRGWRVNSAPQRRSRAASGP